MKTRFYIVHTDFSKREIIAWNKREAKQVFKSQMRGIISNNDKITVK